MLNTKTRFTPDLLLAARTKVGTQGRMYIAHGWEQLHAARSLGTLQIHGGAGAAKGLAVAQVRMDLSD